MGTIRRRTDIEFHVINNPAKGFTFEFYGTLDRADGLSHVLKSSELVEVKRAPNECCEVEPFLALGDDVAQRLMDAMWGAGIRPSANFTRPADGVSASKHLEDMRRIAFHKLGIEKD